MKNVKNNCDEDFWSMFIKRHWKAFSVFVIGCIVALAGAIMVFFWFMETSSIGSMGSVTIGEWTLAWMWLFLLYLIFWGIGTYWHFCRNCFWCWRVYILELII